MPKPRLTALVLCSLSLLAPWLAPPLDASAPQTDSSVSSPPLTPVAAPEPSGLIRLEDALAAALLGNPELAAFALEARAVEARSIQAALRPNPEVALGFENLGGSPEEGSNLQATLSYVHPFELGGKRTARLRLASAERALAAWDYEAKRIDVLTATRKAFAALLGAQRQRELAEESLRIAEEAARSVGLTVRAGAVAPVEELRTRVAQAEAAVELKRAEYEVTASRALLAASWGSSQPRFEAATGSLDIPLHAPPVTQLLARIESNPDLARWTSELEQRRATLAVARSQARPDVSLEGGYRRLDGTDDNLFLLGVSVPLPTRNRNQGAIREAGLRISKAERERDAARTRIEAALADTHRALSSSLAQVEAFQREILPGSRRAFELISTGYKAGKFRFLDLLDAQRTLAQARTRYVQSLVSLHQAIADIERLVGESISAARTHRPEEK